MNFLSRNVDVHVLRLQLLDDDCHVHVHMYIHVCDMHKIINIFILLIF